LAPGGLGPDWLGWSDTRLSKTLPEGSAKGRFRRHCMPGANGWQPANRESAASADNPLGMPEFY